MANWGGGGGGVGLRDTACSSSFNVGGGGRPGDSLLDARRAKSCKGCGASDSTLAGHMGGKLLHSGGVRCFRRRPA